MDARAAMNAMMDNSGKSPAELSEELGRGRTYAYTMRKQSSVPRVDTFARFCHICGYKLKLEREDGKQIELYSDADAMARFHDITSSDSISFAPGSNGWSTIKKDPAAVYGGSFESESDDAISDAAYRLVDDPAFRAKHPDPGDSETYRDDLLAEAFNEAALQYIKKHQEEDKNFFEKPTAEDAPKQGQSTEKKGDSDTKQGSNPRV